jgi:glycosyltransferase involved in cell wall biosynthesis
MKFIDRDDKRKELGVSPDSTMLLSVGELNENKNHQVIIKAIAKMKNNRIQYAICGRGPLHNQLQELATSLGIEDQVKLLGYRADIPEICKAADIFVFPSKREGLPVSLMEAMASGLPVVCSDIRGNRDLIEDGKGGYIVSSDSHNDYVHALNSIIQNKKLSNSMRNKNRETVEFFNISNVTKDLKKVYQENVKYLP